MLKITNSQHVYLNSKKVTLFNVYSLKDGAWYFDYNDFIYGWYKRNKTIATKHCSENGVNINLKDWEF